MKTAEHTRLVEAGLGASHQTGWTGLVATLIEFHGSLDAERTLAEGKEAAFARDP